MRSAMMYEGRPRRDAMPGGPATAGARANGRVPRDGFFWAIFRSFCVQHPCLSLPRPLLLGPSRHHFHQRPHRVHLFFPSLAQHPLTPLLSPPLRSLGVPLRAPKETIVGPSRRRHGPRCVLSTPVATAPSGRSPSLLRRAPSPSCFYCKRAAWPTLPRPCPFLPPSSLLLLCLPVRAPVKGMNWGC
jgi:hypothetical protein